MRYIDIEQVEPGQVLGKTIFSGNGQTLLSENVELTVYMINTLRRIGVSHIFIKDPQFADIEIEDLVSEETKRQVVSKMSELFASLRSGKTFQSRGLSVGLDVLLDEIMQNSNVLVQLSDIRTEDNDQYIHALNVCMMAVLIGINMDFTHSQLKELAIGALLHDIGKVGLDPEKEEPNDRGHHTWRGFELLKKDFSLLVAHIALQHHETCDGEGVPRKLTDEHIHIYAKIVAVVNMYDNLLFDRTKGETLLPHEACERLMAFSGTKLDHGALTHFMKVISIYPTGTSVRLSTKETGIVVGQHRGLPSRPIVRIVSGDVNEALEVKEIDLAQHPTVFIERVLS